MAITEEQLVEILIGFANAQMHMAKGLERELGIPNLAGKIASSFPHLPPNPTLANLPVHATQRALANPMRMQEQVPELLAKVLHGEFGQEADSAEQEAI